MQLNLLKFTLTSSKYELSFKFQHKMFDNLKEINNLLHTNIHDLSDYLWQQIKVNRISFVIGFNTFFRISYIFTWFYICLLKFKSFLLPHLHVTYGHSDKRFLHRGLMFFLRLGTFFLYQYLRCVHFCTFFGMNLPLLNVFLHFHLETKCHNSHNSLHYRLKLPFFE